MVLHTQVYVIGYFRRDHDTNELFLHRGWSILGFPVPVESDPNKCKNWALYILFHICVPTSLCFFWVISPENYEVASFLITGSKLPLNDADYFRRSNGVLVLITLFSRATSGNIKFHKLFCQNDPKKLQPPIGEKDDYDKLVKIALKKNSRIGLSNFWITTWVFKNLGRTRQDRSWRVWILTLHHNYVPGYTNSLLFLFAGTDPTTTTFFFLCFFGLLCLHTASASITTDTHTRGAQ